MHACVGRPIMYSVCACRPYAYENLIVGLRRPALIDINTQSMPS